MATLMLTVCMLLACTAQKIEMSSEPCEACAGDCVTESQPVAQYGHVDGDVVYEDAPPTSGNHNSCWAPYGVHDEDLGDEHWVHNLEHGAVVFVYPNDCIDCAESVAALEAVMATGSDPRWIIAPYAEIATGWAAVSWGYRDLYGCFDLSALTAFFEARVGQGREDLTTAPSTTCWDTAEG